MAITIQTFPSGPIETNTYLVLDGQGHALIVDASHDVATTILAAAREAGAEIDAVIITHPHWDHIGDAAALKAATGAPLIAHRGAVEKMEQTGTALSPDMPPTAPSTPDQFLGDGDTYTLGQETFQIWHLPGHEPSHIVLYHPEQGIVIGGDVLFPGGHGRIDIPGADAQDMQQSLTRLATLPDEVVVYTGHGDPTTIGAERSWLPKA